MDKMVKLYRLSEGTSKMYCKSMFGPVDEESSTPNKIVYLGFGKTKDKIGSDPNFTRTIRKIKEGKIRYWTHYKGKYGDVGSAGGFKVFSSKFIDLLKENGITNFRAYPLIIINEDSPKYYYIEVKNRVKKYPQGAKRKGLIDFSGLDPSWNKMDKFRVYFGLDDWEGEDLFTIEDTLSAYICTEKIKKIAEKNKLKNVKLGELYNDENKK